MIERLGALLLAIGGCALEVICDTVMTDNQISCLLEEFEEVEHPRCRR